MRQNITKLLLILLSISFLAFIGPKNADAAAPDIHGEVYVAGMDAYLNPGGLRLWALMTDNRDGRRHYRYNRTSAVDGHYTFFSWQDVARTNPGGMVNTWINPTHPEENERTNQFAGYSSEAEAGSNGWVRQADSIQYAENGDCGTGCPIIGFGCSELPIMITLIKPHNWSGSFTAVSINPGQVDSKGQTYGNGLSIYEAPSIYYQGTNQASCTVTSAPSQVTSGQSFAVSVVANNPAGGNPWTKAGGYSLGRFDDYGSYGWIFPNGSQNRVTLPTDPVLADNSVTFNFSVKAPSVTTPKNYFLDVKMVQDGVAWFGTYCSKPVTVQPAGNPTSPLIKDLTITNSGGNASASKTSGLNTDQLGIGYYNPMTITLIATAGNNADGTTPTTDYYVAFYNKSSGIISSPTQFLETIKTRLNDLNKGFLLKYDNSGKYWVWARNRWQDITSFRFGGGFSLCNLDNIPQGCNDSNILYRVYPSLESKPNEWRVLLDKNFGSKDMYTTVYILDKNSLSAYRDEVPVNQ